MQIPDVHYARSGEVAIAYQTLGGGTVDVVFARGFAGDLLSVWEQPLLPSVRVPTVVLSSEAERGPGRYFAEQIPGARLVELPASLRSIYHWIDDDVHDIAMRETRKLAAVEAPVARGDRVLATVLFTDIVGSTERASQLGDRAWRHLLERHHAVVRRRIAQFRGEEIDTAGDGFFASFDGPGRAIECARTLVADVRALGLELRVGVHTGECERHDGKLTGIAVPVGARVANTAAPGEVLVSSTVKDLVAGSGIEFEDRGVHELKGVPGEWRLYAVGAA